MRFYMHVSNGTGFVEDEEGRELPDEATARAEAITAARDLMAGDLREGHLDLNAFIAVEDEARKPLFTINFGDVVTVTARR